MKTQTNTFKNADGLRIHTIQWLPEGEIKAVVLLAHGIGEHSGRYEHVAQRLTDDGYAVYALDYRGHGKSEGLRTYFDSFDQPVQELEQYLGQIKQEQAGHKLFVFGHSMGALISLIFVLKHQDELAGWVSSGTPLNLEESSPAVVNAVGTFLSRFIPKVELLPFSAEDISRDPEVVKAYKADPLVSQRPVRLGMGANFLQAGKALRKQISQLHLPILIVHGTEDKVSPVSGSSFIYQHASSEDKTLKLYDGFYHELHNEPEHDQYLQDVVDWLNSH